MADYQNPKAGNAILDDLQEIVALINSGAKLDPTGNTNIPNGAKRVVSVTGGYQIQSYNGTTWVSVGKLMHDCDSVDGKSPNTGTAAGTIPVRDNKGQLPGDITGNAGTATKLATARTIDLGGILSATEQSFDGSKPITIPVNSVNINNDNDDAVVGVLTKAHGGTGRTDGAAADVVVSSAQGQVKASAYGQVGDAKNINGVDLDTLTVSGNYIATSGTVENHYPYGGDFVWRVNVCRQGTSVRQILFTDEAIWTRQSTNTGTSWSGFKASGTRGSSLVLYISKSGNDLNTGLNSVNPVLTVNRALQIAHGWAPSYADITVSLCFGEGNWGSINFQKHPFTIVVYPYDHTNPTEYSASLPVFDGIFAYYSDIVLRGVVANQVNAYLGTIILDSAAYQRIGTFLARYCGNIIINGSASAPVIDIMSINPHECIFRAYNDGTIMLTSYRTFNIVENLNLSNGTLFLSQGQFYGANYVTFTLGEGVAVTGRKYFLYGSSYVSFTKEELDALPGSTAGRIDAGANVVNVPWGGGDAHTFLAADGTWKKDSDSISAHDSGYANDIAIDGNTSDMASARGLYWKAVAKGAVDLNTLTTPGLYGVTCCGDDFETGMLNFPGAACNGLVLVYLYGTIIKQIFLRQGTLNSNDFHMWTRTCVNETSWGDWNQIATNRGIVFTGNVVFSGNGSGDVYQDVRFSIRALNDADGTTRDFVPFRIINGGTSSGHGLIMQTGGPLVIGAGESGTVLANYLVPEDRLNGTSETLYLASDGNIFLYTNVQDVNDNDSSRFLFSQDKNLYCPGTIVCHNDKLTKGDTPTATTYKNIAFGQAEASAVANRFGLLENVVYTDNHVSTYISAYKNEAGSTARADVGVKYPISGSPTGYAPTPPEDSDTNDIATTEWVNNKAGVDRGNASVSWKSLGTREIETSYTETTAGMLFVYANVTTSNHSLRISVTHEGTNRDYELMHSYNSTSQNGTVTLQIPKGATWRVYRNNAAATTSYTIRFMPNI